MPMVEFGPMRDALAISALALIGSLPTLAPPLHAAPAAEESADEVVLTGEVTREEIERALPGWVGETVEARIDVEDATALASVEPGATVTVYLGTWCSDSAREVPRFWRAMDQVGGMVPFEVELIAVDRAENRPPELVEAVDLRYVPTFVVSRGGEEVGRVVETSPHGIETDLLALLTGRASGVLSTRDDLGD